MATNKELESNLSELKEEVRAIDVRVKLLEEYKDGKTYNVTPFTDDQLDGQYGNSRIFKDPPEWVKKGGESFQNLYLNQAPPEYLDILAKYLIWLSGSNEKQANDPVLADRWGGKEKLMKRAKYQRLDAAKAMGWARRKRGGWTLSPEEDRDLRNGNGSSTVDELGF